MTKYEKIARWIANQNVNRTPNDEDIKEIAEMMFGEKLTKTGIRYVKEELSKIDTEPKRITDSGLFNRIQEETNNFTESYTGKIIVTGRELTEAVRILQKYYVDVEWRKLPEIKPAHPSGKQIPQYEVCGDVRKTIKDSKKLYWDLEYDRVVSEEYIEKLYNKMIRLNLIDPDKKSYEEFKESAFDEITDDKKAHYGIRDVKKNETPKEFMKRENKEKTTKYEVVWDRDEDEENDFVVNMETFKTLEEAKKYKKQLEAKGKNGVQIYETWLGLRRRSRKLIDNTEVKYEDGKLNTYECSVYSGNIELECFDVQAKNITSAKNKAYRISKNLRGGDCKLFITQYPEDWDGKTNELKDASLTHKQKLWYGEELEKFIHPQYLRRNYQLKRTKKKGKRGK